MWRKQHGGRQLALAVLALLPQCSCKDRVASVLCGDSRHLVQLASHYGVMLVASTTQRVGHVAVAVGKEVVLELGDGGVKVVHGVGELAVSAQPWIESPRDVFNFQVVDISSDNHHVELYAHVQFVVLDVSVCGIDEVALFLGVDGLQWVVWPDVGARFHLDDV